MYVSWIFLPSKLSITGRGGLFDGDGSDCYSQSNDSELKYWNTANISQEKRPKIESISEEKVDFHKF